MKITNRLKVMLKSILSLKFGEVNTDNGTLVWDGDAELKEGVEVFIMNEENEAIAAPYGDYITEDGKVIKVVDGKVAEIADPEAEVAPETEEEIEAETEVKAEDEVEPADEPEAEPDANDEDRIAVLEEKVGAIVEGINQIVNSIAALEGRIAEVEGKLAKVEEPAAEPVDEVTIEEEAKPTRLSIMRQMRKN